jgi:arsenate reductase (thioredoxin)
MKKTVLFVCIHNSARSQMAEAWLNHLCGEHFVAESAGLEPGKLNPLAVAVMREAGIDISSKKTQGVSDVLKSGQSFSYVVTVCDETSAERCPIFPGVMTRLHWGFSDPAAVTGTDDEQLAKVRVIRDQIRAKIEVWCTELTGAPCWLPNPREVSR